MKTIIGLTAKGGCGKSAVADILVEKYGFTRVSFAAALKEEVARVYGFPVEWCYSQEGKCEPVVFSDATGSAPWPWPLTADGTPSVREILQWYGTEYMRAKDPDHWANITAETLRTTSSDRIVLDDMRFPNELVTVASAGGHTVRMHPYPEWQPPEGMDMSHASETALDGSAVDFEVHPGYGPGELDKMALQLMERFLWIN